MLRAVRRVYHYDSLPLLLRVTNVREESDVEDERGQKALVSLSAHTALSTSMYITLAITVDSYAVLRLGYPPAERMAQRAACGEPISA